MPHHLPHHGGVSGMTGGGHIKKKMHPNGTHSGGIVASHETP